MSKSFDIRIPTADIVALSFPEPRRSARAAPRRRIRLLGWLRLWARRSRARREMRLLALHQSDHLLRDVGLSRAQLLRQSAVPFWRP